MRGTSHRNQRQNGRSGRCLTAATSLLLSAALVLASCGSGRRTAATTSAPTTVPARASAARAVSPPERSDSTTSTAPATTAPGTGTRATAASCPAASGSVATPGGETLVRAPATDHLRPAVVMLHGYTGTTTGEEAVSGWTQFLAGTDVVVAYPQGNPTDQGGYGWTTGTAEFSTTGTDDVAAVAKILTWLVRDNCVDPDQILIAGESNGSAMSLLLACSGRLPVTPRLYALAIPAVDANVTGRCTGAAPFPLIVFASRLDATVPYDGKPGDPAAPSAPRSWFTSLIPTLEGCTSTAGTTRQVPDGDLLTYGGCHQTAAFYSVDDGHHTWQGGPTGTAGLDPGRFPAARIAWCASGLHTAPPPVADCPALLATYGLG